MEREKIMAWTICWEGLIGIYKTKRSKGYALQYTPRIGVDNTNEQLLKKFADLVGYGKIYRHRRYSSTWKDLWNWNVYNLKECKRFCEEVLPYLPAKQRQAELVLKFCNIRLKVVRKGRNYRAGETTWTEKEEEIYQELRILNRRGK